MMTTATNRIGRTFLILIALLTVLTHARVSRADDNDDTQASAESETPAQVEAPAPAAPAAPPTTGMIDVPRPIMTITVDGEYVRVRGGRAEVRCGKRRINTGRGTTLVDVPCTGPAIQVGETTHARVDAPLPKMSDATPTRSSRPIRVDLAGDGAYGAQDLFTLPIRGAEGGVSVVAQRAKYLAIRSITRMSYGETHNRLGISIWRFGAQPELVFDRVRVGVGVSAMIVSVSRALRDSSVVAVRPSVQAVGTLDVVRSDRLTLFVRAAVEVAEDFWGVTLGPGIGFEITHTRSANSSIEK